MVKKNLVNKNVVRALSIGLSLAMMSQPLTAMAAEPDAPATEPVKDAPALQPKTAAENAAAQAEVVKEAVDTNTANVQDVVDATKDAASKAEALDVNASDVNADVTAVENGKKAAEAVTELEKITSDTEGETTLAGLAQGVATAEENVEKPVKSVEEAVFGDKEKETPSLSEKLESANEAVEEASSKISGANSIDAVNSAYTDAANAVNDADEAVNAADEAVKNAEKELEVKEDEFNSLAEQYEIALKAFNDKVDALNTAKANALKALGYSDAKGAEGLSDELASLYAEDEKEVADMEASLEVLKNNLATAEKNYKQSGYGYIAALENVIAANGKAEYGTGNGEVKDVSIEKIEEKDSKVKATYRNLFKAIVQTYYVPEVLGGTFVKVEAAPVENGDYYYNGDTTNPNNKSSRGDVLRYFVVTYKDADGVEKTVKLNYKTANENKKDGYKGIVIFEKTEHILIDGKESKLTAEQLDTLAEEGSEITLADGTIIKRVDGQLVKFSNTAGAQNGTLKEATGEKPIVNGNVTTEVAVSDAGTTWTYNNGTLVKTVSQDVTTTTYTGKTLVKQDNTLSGTSATDDSNAKKAYREALKAAIKALEKDDELIIGNVSFNKADFEAGKYSDEQLLTGYEGTSTSKEEEDGTYTVKGTYNKVNTTQKAVSGSKSVNGLNWSISEDEAREEYYSDVEDLLDDYSFDDHIFLVDGDGYQTDYNLINYSIGTPNISGNNKKRYYTGTVTLSYQNVKSETKDKSWMIFTYGGVKDDDIRKALAAEGKYYLGKTEFGDGVDSYTIHYVDATSTENKSVTADNAEAAKEAFESAFSDAEHVKVTSVEANKTTKYYFGYKELSYKVKSIVNSVNKVTYSWSTTDNNNLVLAAAASTTTEYRNDNWYSGDVISIKVDKNNNNAFVADYKTDGKSQNGNKAATVKDTAKSEALVSKINEAKNKIGQYDAAIAAVKTAEDKVKAAEGEVETLKGLIEQISFSKKDNILAGLRSRLETAETELATAKAARDQLLEDLRTLDGQRAQRITALTPAPSGEGGGETGGEGGATTPGGTVVIPGAAAPLAAAPAMFVAAPGGAGAPAAAAAVAEDNTVTLTEQRTALSDAVPEAQTEQATENIDDGKTALAAAPVSEETLSWWWLLIIAVLGGAGYTMYRKFHNKKDEKTTN